MLETLSEVEPVNGSMVPNGLVDLLNRLGYSAATLRHDEVVKFLKQVQIDNEQ